MKNTCFLLKWHYSRTFSKFQVFIFQSTQDLTKCWGASKRSDMVYYTAYSLGYTLFLGGRRKPAGFQGSTHSLGSAKALLISRPAESLLTKSWLTQCGRILNILCNIYITVLSATSIETTLMSSKVKSILDHISDNTLTHITTLSLLIATNMFLLY